jgi:hypothetical protein
MSAKKEEHKLNVVVLSRREVSVFPKLGQEVKQLLVTYVAAGLPPKTITIDKDKWSIDVEKMLIKEDVSQRLKEKPETYTV